MLSIFEYKDVTHVDGIGLFSIMGYDHQDWESVILSTNKKRRLDDSAAASSAAAPAASYVASGIPSWKVEQMVDGDTGKPVRMVSKDDATYVRDNRVICKLTQKALAQLANVQEKDVKDIENGSAVENRQLVSKLKRILQSRLAIDETLQKA